jgi:hypothetical protein
MKLLRRTLYLHAVVWAGCGLALAVLPRLVMRTVFDQVPYPDYAYVRVAGVLSFGLALLMVLVVQGSEDRWWWSWAFVLVDVGVGGIALANALGGAPAGSGRSLWWLFSGTSLVLGVGLIAGLAKTGTERPPV